MAITVITYGGGVILKNIFTAMAMLMNNNSSSLLQPLLVLSSSIGALWATTTALFSGSVDDYLKKFVFPLIAVSAILMIPSTSVRIEDVLQPNKSCKVDHVPFLLARFSELISTLGYKVTIAVEGVMHTNNDEKYKSTGMIFGGDAALEFDQYKITNGALQQNLRRFAKQCVLYDVALGLYDINDVKKSTNLWKLFEEKTSKTRMIQYCDPESAAPKKCTYCSCKEAVTKMAPFFEKEKNYYAQHDILKDLPLAFQALTGVKQDQQEIIGQQLVMNLLSDEYSTNNFAKIRAREQQKSTYLVVGSLASTSLVTMRCVLEALLYAVFIFVIPMSVLPGGLKFISTWIWLLIWIQMWPPLFAILNFIMQIVAQSKATTVFHGLASNQVGLSFFSSSGLTSLQQNIYALASYLSLSVPMISYAIMKGGEHSIASLTGTMSSPAQSAGSAAAAEMSTGNYSFANTSFGQESFQNTTAFQKNYAPSMSSGFMTENTGSSSITYGANESIIRQANSDLRTSILSDETMNQSIQESQQRALSNAENRQRSYTESVASHTRNFTDLTEYLSKGENTQDSTNTKLGFDVNESARNLQSISHSWGEQYGLNQRESMEVLTAAGASAGVGGGITDYLGLKFGGSIESKLASNKGASRDDILTSAQNVAHSADFQRNMQQIEGAIKSGNLSFNDDEGARLSFGAAKSLDEVKSSQELKQAAFNEMHQINKTAAWAKNNSDSVKTAYNQEFVNWASEQYKDRGGAQYVDEVFRGTDSASKQEKASMITGFFGHVGKQQPQSQSGYFSGNEGSRHEEVAPWTDADKTSMKKEYYERPIKQLNPVIEKQKIDEFKAEKAAKHNLYHGMVREKGEKIQNKYSEIEQNTAGGIASARKDIAQENTRIVNDYEQRQQSDVQEQLANDTKFAGFAIGMVPRLGWNSNFRTTSKPFSLIAQEHEKQRTIEEQQ